MPKMSGTSCENRKTDVSIAIKYTASLFEPGLNSEPQPATSPSVVS